MYDVELTVLICKPPDAVVHPSQGALDSDITATDIEGLNCSCCVRVVRASLLPLLVVVGQVLPPGEDSNGDLLRAVAPLK